MNLLKFIKEHNKKTDLCPNMWLDQSFTPQLYQELSQIQYYFSEEELFKSLIFHITTSVSKNTFY